MDECAILNIFHSHPRLWQTYKMDTESRAPKQNDTVMVEGRAGLFVVTGIDSTNKTVEVRTSSAPLVVVKDVPWADLSYPE
jgi:hypothetical protein